MTFFYFITTLGKGKVILPTIAAKRLLCYLVIISTDNLVM